MLHRPVPIFIQLLAGMFLIAALAIALTNGLNYRMTSQMVLNRTAGYTQESVEQLSAKIDVLLRQYAASVLHDELINAGRIDGCHSFDLYWRVALPVLRPALATLGIITFLGSWNDYLWPLVVISVQDKFTIQMLIASMNGVYSTDYSMVMAATMMATVPLIIVFSLFSRQFIAGLMQGSVKD